MRPEKGNHMTPNATPAPCSSLACLHCWPLSSTMAADAPRCTTDRVSGKPQMTAAEVQAYRARVRAEIEASK